MINLIQRVGEDLMRSMAEVFKAILMPQPLSKCRVVNELGL